MRPAKFLSLLLVLACDSTAGPNPLYPSYYLTRVDEKFLPVPWGEDGSVLIDASLRFDREVRPRAPTPANGLVHYTLRVRLPDHSVQLSTVDLDYVIENGELRINLCPPLALCIARTELIGPVPDPALELVLTHYLGSSAVAVYRYSVVLLE